MTDRPFFHRLDELLDNLEVYIRFQQCHLDFLERNSDVRLCQSAFAAQILKHILQFIG